MTDAQLPLLLVGVLLIAFLYSSVGHAGASGYIAIMSLFSLPPEFIRPTALGLNILVASIATVQFWRAGHFSWNLFWPFALLSVPMALVGGYVTLPAAAFKVVVGVVLLWSARYFFSEPSPDIQRSEPPRPVAVTVGAGLGLLSGLTGTGGGIFLTPLLLFCQWARVRTAAAVSALFILVNSAAGLLGALSNGHTFPRFAWPLIVAAAVGGAAGSYLGSRRLSHLAIKRMLALLLVIAGSKLLLTR